MVISEDPSLSIRQMSQNDEISYSLTRLILKDDLDLKPYKLPDFHELEQADFPKKLDFCNWVKVHSQMNHTLTLLRQLTSRTAVYGTILDF
jgi:hypothetical protein